MFLVITVANAKKKKQKKQDKCGGTQDSSAATCD